MPRTKKAIQAVPHESAIVPRKEDVSIEAIITTALDKGVPVETMERLLAMRRELKAEAAKEAFDSAMAKFQSECPTIVKTKEVRGRNGEVAYRYAPIESIVEQVKEPIQRNGFSYKTDQELKEHGVKVTVRVIHQLGHSEDTSMEVPFGSQTQIMSNSQVAAAATTFAKRYAFCNAFGILTGDEDTDAAPQREAAPIRGGVIRNGGNGIVDRNDQPFASPPPAKAPVDPITAKKTAIAKQLLKLGHDVRVMSGAQADETVLKLTGLDMVIENYDEIETRLGVKVSEFEDRPGFTDEDFNNNSSQHGDR